MKITRRLLLSSVAAFALTRSALGQPYPSISGTDQFQGNPNVTITSIAGSIECSRTGGQTPAFIQVSASTVTAVGTNVPYEDLEFRWNFGDPQGTETFTHPVTGKLVNANEQFGPEAVYCYRKAGNFTITLNIRGKNGNGFATATLTKPIAVTAFRAAAAEYWFDSVDGNDGNTGRNPSVPKKSLAALNRLMSNDCAFHLKAGSSWSGQTGIEVTYGKGSRVRIDSYGTGPSPIVEVNSGTSSALLYTNGTPSVPSAKDDVVISGITFRLAGTATAARWGAVAHVNAIPDTGATITNFFYDHCNFANTLYLDGTTAVFQQASRKTPISMCGIWGGSITSPIPIGTTTKNRMGVFCAMRDWTFFVGCEVAGSGTHNVYDHHIYQIVQNHTLFRWIKFGPGANRNMCIKLAHYGPGDTLEFANFHLISECYMSGTQRGHSADDSTLDPTKVQFENVVSQQNVYAGLLGDGIMIFNNGKSVTERDNFVWGCNGGRWWGAGPGNVLRAKVYRNRIYHSVRAAMFDRVSQRDPWSQPLLFTDNIIYCADTAANVLDVVMANEVKAGSIIDRNQYWVPNVPGGNSAKFFYDGTTGKTFAQWQAAGFDKNGRVANPNWRNPANGEF